MPKNKKIKDFTPKRIKYTDEEKLKYWLSREEDLLSTLQYADMRIKQLERKLRK